MRSPRRRLRLLLLLTCGLAGWGAAQAEARPFRTLNLDRDVPASDVIILARIQASKFTHGGWFESQWEGRRKPTPQNQGLEVDFHDVTAEIVMSVRGSHKPGSTLQFRHRMESSSGQPIMDGFLSHAFVCGRTYMLVLRKETDGVLAVPAPETYFYPTFPDALLRHLPGRARGVSDLDYVLRLLQARFQYGIRPDEVAIWSGAEMLRSEAGRKLGRSSALRPCIVKRLEDMIDRDVGSDAHRQVLWMLSTLNKPVSIEKISGWILDPKLPETTRVNLVGELRVAPTPARIKVLDDLAKKVTDKQLHAAITRASDYARGQLARDVEQERLRREAAEEKKR